MHANRNKGALKRVEKGMMKANRTRNLFAILAIILTTFMITTVFSLGINYKENAALMQIRMAGTTAQVSLSTPTPAQEQQIRKLDYVTSAGIQYPVGSVSQKNEEGRELSILLSCYDEAEWDTHYLDTISRVNGSYPAKENEIMLCEDALSQLGITKPTLGMELTLSYTDKNGPQQKTFLLSGWFRSYTGTGMGFVSESYCKNAGYTLESDGLLSLSLKNMPDDFYRIQEDISLQEGQSFQSSIEIKSSSGSVFVMLLLLVLFIIGSGYLLIYNVLYISIAKDTRFYGLVKTLGTTQTQIKALVKNQAARFALIGIPVGILLATAVSFGLAPFVLKRAFDEGKSAMDIVVFFHPSIYVLSVLFSSATVFLACNAPAKAAARIAPVEALKYQSFTAGKRKDRNSTNGGKLHVMAVHNVFRDKKRAVLVFLSLFMGITMILGVNGIVKSFKVENFIREDMDYHFEYQDIQFVQPDQPEKEVSQFDDHFVEQLRQLDGVRSVDLRKTVWSSIAFDEAALGEFMRVHYPDSGYCAKGTSYEEMVEDLRQVAAAGEYGCYIMTLDDEAVLETYNQTHSVPIDIKAYQRGEVAISGTDNDFFAPNAALIGKTLTLTADSPDASATDFYIGGAFDVHDYSSNSSDRVGRRTFVDTVPHVIYVSEAGMQRLTKTPVISYIGVDIQELDQLEQMDAKLQEINRTIPSSQWEFKSALSRMQFFNQTNYSLNLLGNGAAILLIVIGLVNFINVMLTSVVSRKYEFAIMESIGTTKKQIRMILTMEGGIYALISTGLIMTFGNAFLFLVARAVPHIASYAAFTYPFGLVLGLIAAIFVICLGTPGIVYQAISRETVIERLHNFET